ncbi:division plane positioning ATPase MipZ [Magnetovibrio blakemorei]|uniref:ATPase n=1 Tax=Magnetovibrio blakemorei TaxID=28181 RepID=A0A1E5Q9L1_9PROT|nr:division plane positioning ATPase MipZ [Magnetovibrio blakemorei]OEJ68105.1 ATPase [Magnetovibrio blakemorei]
MRTHVIIIGNEKGGSGKSTTVMHLAVSLLRQGLRVTVVDLDARQGTISRYFENRQLHMKKHSLDLPIPELLTLRAEDGGGDAEGIEELLAGVFEDASNNADVIIADTPGSDTPMSRLAHSFADTLITPMNDSFIDLDVLAKIDPGTMTIKNPSHYAELVWQQRMIRAKRGRKAADWIVMRNRMGHTDSINKREIERLLADLAKRIGFRTVAGFSERVIFRELFHQGLTLMDVAEVSGESALSMSHIAARQEVRALVEAINLS